MQNSPLREFSWMHLQLQWPTVAEFYSHARRKVHNWKRKPKSLYMLTGFKNSLRLFPAWSSTFSEIWYTLGQKSDWTPSTMYFFHAQKNEPSQTIRSSSDHHIGVNLSTRQELSTPCTIIKKNREMWRYERVTFLDHDHTRWSHPR